MPRQQKPLIITGPVAEFAAELRALRTKAQSPPYRTLAARAHYSASVLSQATAGRSLPTWEVTRAFVQACGGDVQEWERRWKRARDRVQGAADNPTPGTDASNQPPVAPADLDVPRITVTTPITVGGYLPRWGDQWDFSNPLNHATWSALTTPSARPHDDTRADKVSVHTNTRSAGGRRASEPSGGDRQRLSLPPWLIALIALAGVGLVLVTAFRGLDVLVPAGVMLVGLIMVGAQIVLARSTMRESRRVNDLAQRHLAQVQAHRVRQTGETFAQAVGQLGSDAVVVRLAGAYALEQFAQDYPSYRQPVIDVLCAYLRLPFTLPPRTFRGRREIDAETDVRSGEQEVRVTVQRIIAKHLRRGPDHWSSINLDLRGATLLKVSFSGADIGAADFTDAQFTDDTRFVHTRFSGPVDLSGARFFGHAYFRATQFASTIRAERTRFRGVGFEDATVAQDATFRNIVVQNTASFARSHFQQDFSLADARMTTALFNGMEVAGKANFDRTEFIESIDFTDARLATVTFRGTTVAPARETPRRPSRRIWPPGWTTTVPIAESPQGDWLNVVSTTPEDGPSLIDQAILRHSHTSGEALLHVRVFQGKERKKLVLIGDLADNKGGFFKATDVPEISRLLGAVSRAMGITTLPNEPNLQWAILTPARVHPDPEKIMLAGEEQIFTVTNTFPDEGRASIALNRIDHFGIEQAAGGPVRAWDERTYTSSTLRDLGVRTIEAPRTGSNTNLASSRRSQAG